MQTDHSLGSVYICVARYPIVDGTPMIPAAGALLKWEAVSATRPSSRARARACARSYGTLIRRPSRSFCAVTYPKVPGSITQQCKDWGNPVIFADTPATLLALRVPPGSKEKLEALRILKTLGEYMGLGRCGDEHKGKFKYFERLRPCASPAGTSQPRMGAPTRGPIGSSSPSPRWERSGPPRARTWRR